MLLQRLGNRGLFLGELFEQAAREHPYQLLTLDRPLSVAPELGCELTAYTCANLVAELAAALRDAGVSPDDRVVIHKADNFDVFILLCAVAHLGAIPVALAPELPAETVRPLIERCAPTHLILDNDSYHRWASKRPGLDAGQTVTFVVGSQERGTVRLRPHPIEVAREYRRPNPHRPMLVTHTSGTTGIPKLVVHTAWSMRARYRPQAIGAQLLIRQHETVAVQVSFVHSRLVTAMAIALRRGTPLVILGSVAPDNFAELLARTRPSVVEALPNALIEWESLADHPSTPLANLKLLSTTFDAIHPRTVKTLLSASKRRLPLHVQLYGQSEVGPVAVRLVTKRACDRKNWRSIGFPFFGMTAIRILNDPNASTPVGSIAVKTDGRAVSYVGEHERFGHQLDDGWWRMGDVGRRNWIGDVQLADREVDQVDGIASALAIEDRLLERMVDLLEVVVISDNQGRPTPIVATKGDTPINTASWKLATQDYPGLQAPIQLPSAEIPRTSTRKVQRGSLTRKLFQANQT